MYSPGLCACQDYGCAVLHVLAEPMVVPAWRKIASGFTRDRRVPPSLSLYALAVNWSNPRCMINV